MLWLRKSKKGFTLIELMVVVAIIGILALLGLRMYTGQQDKAKNAIVKANTATVHTIIQGNLADTDYSSLTGIGNGTDLVDAQAAVKDIRDQFGDYLVLTPGKGLNSERPAGMQNPHLTGTSDPDNIVVTSAVAYATAVAFAEVDRTTLKTTYAGAVLVGYDTVIKNRFYIMGLDNEAEQLGEVYIAQK